MSTTKVVTVKFEGEHKDLVKTLEKVTAELERLKAKTAAANEKTKTLATGVGGLKKVAGAAGGPVSKLVNGIADMGEGVAALATSLGPVTLAIGATVGAFAAMTLAAAGTAKAAYDFMNANVSLAAEMAKNSNITKETAEKYEKYGGQVDNLTTTLGKLQLAFGEELLGPMGDTLRIMNKLGGATMGLDKVFSEMSKGFIAGFISPSTAAGIKNVADAFDDDGKAAGEAKISMEKLNTAVKTGVDDAIAATTANKALAKSHRETAEEIENRVNKEVQLERTLKMQQGKEVLKVQQDLIDKRFEADRAALDESIAMEEEADARRLENKQDFYSKLEDYATQAATMIADFFVNEAARSAEDEINSNNAKIEAIRASGHDLTQKQLGEIKSLEAANKSARLKEWKASKLGAAFNIALSTAQAIAASIAQLGVPAGLPGAAIAGAMGATQLALAAAQSPPQFPSGGRVAPDHKLIGVAGGEGIVSKRGMENLGESGLNALNSGTSAGQTITVINQYKHEVFDSFVYDNIKKGGPLTDRFNQGRKIGHANGK